MNSYPNNRPKSRGLVRNRDPRFDNTIHGRQNAESNPAFAQYSRAILSYRPSIHEVYQQESMNLPQTDLKRHRTTVGSCQVQQVADGAQRVSFRGNG